MNKAAPVKLSLRKLFVAMLAIGPLAILPAPLWAIPTTSQFTVTNGSVVFTSNGVSGPGGTATFQVPDRTVIVWGNNTTTGSVYAAGTFNVLAGETWSFSGLPSTGAVLNKVGYAVGGSPLGSIDTATISGNLNSSGKVFILANGNIQVNSGASINTSGGVVLSTLLESSDFNFTTTGNLALNGSSTGSINLGSTGASAVSVTAGNLAAWAGTVAVKNLTVQGDLILNQTGSTTALDLANVGTTFVGGNLTVVTNNGTISDTNALTAGTATTTTTLSSGTAAITLTNASNSLPGTINATTSAAETIFSTGNVTLGTSTVGSLSVSTPLNIATSGAVASTNNVALTSTTAGNITFANGSSVGSTGVLSASTPSGNVTINTVGNLTTGAISAGPSLTNSILVTNAGAGYTAVPTVAVSGGGGTGATATVVVNTTTGLVTGASITAVGTGYSSAPTITLTGGGINPTTAATAGAITLDSGTGVALGAVAAATGGAGYTAAPTVTITGGGGTGATATATISTTTGAVTGFTVTANGTGYTSAPTFTLVGGGTNPTTKAVVTDAIAAGSGSISITTAGALSLGGNINALGQNVTVTAASVSSNSTANIGAQLTANNIVVSSSAGNVILPGTTSNNLTVTATGGSISQVGTLSTQVLTIVPSGTNSTVTANAGANNITLTANNALGSSTIYLTGNSASVTDTGNITLGNTSLAGGLTINTVPSSFGNGTVTVGNGFGTLYPVINVGGATSISTNGSNVTDDVSAQENFYGAITINTVAGGYGALANNISITSAGAGLLIAPTVTITGNFGGSNATATATITTNVLTGVSITSGGGGFAVGSTPTFAFIGAGTPTTAATLGATVLTPGLPTASAIASIPIATAGTGYVAAPSVVISSGSSNATATAVVNTVTNTLVGINVGSGGNYTAAPTISLLGGGNGGVTAPVVSATVIPAGTVSFTAATAQGKAAYGQWNVTAGSVNLQENTTLNLGNITAGSVTANSSAGDVLVNGSMTVLNAGSASLRASSGNVIEGASGVITAALVGGAVGNASVTVNTSNTAGYGANLSNSGNSFLNLTVTNGANDVVVMASPVTLQQSSVPSGNLTVTTVNTGTSGNITISAGSFGRTATFNSGSTIFLTSNNSTNSVTANNLVLIAGDTSATSISQNTTSTSQIVSVNGTLNLTTAGGINLNGTNNPLSATVTLNGVGGPTVINSRGNLSVNGTSLGAVTLTSGTVGQNSIPLTSTITLGNLTAQSLTANAQNSGYSGNAADLAANGASGNIVQAAGTAIHVETTLNAITYGGGSIVLANNGNSDGRVQLSTGGALGVAGPGNITYVEDPGVKVGQIATTGNASITSRFSSIVEDNTTNTGTTTLLVNGASSVLTLAAPNGSILLGSLTTNAATTGNVVAANLSASGSAALVSSTTGNFAVGAVNANSLVINATAGNITQTAPFNIYGTANFTAVGNISVTNPGNNFGPIILTSNTSTAHDIAIVESGTMNLRTVNMFGTTSANFTATSVGGDIISTGFGGVKPGGVVGAPGSGTVTLSATNGNITVGDATTDFPTTTGVVFNAKNVSLTVLGNSSLVLGAASTPSTATGNLSVTSAIGSILNAGNIVVTGNASFQSGSGNISLNQSGDQFGALKFIGNLVSITESNNMQIQTGSSALGTAQLASGGNISIANIGGLVSFGNTVSLVASGNITLPKLIQAANTITVNAAGTKDLSALSISGDLGNKTPVNLGTGAYTGPQP